jgi:radical SAM superfamily enzyme YgiQ (UPF0313 family)
MEKHADVLIINSPLFQDTIEGYDEDSLPPLGLGYIATNLQSNGMTVEIIDTVEENVRLDALVKTIEQKRPSFVALNVFTTNVHLVREILESVAVETHFILGSLATKSLYQEILGWHVRNPLDVVIGEGDYAVSAIVQKEPLDILFQEGNRRVVLVPVDSPYFPHDISNIPLDRSFFTSKLSRTPSGLDEACIVTSRGCMYNCAFCSAARSSNRETPIRERNSESVADEIGMLRELYGNMRSVRVLDDLFLRNAASVDRAIRIFGNLPVTWRAMAHVLSFHRLSDEQIFSLRRSGCSEVFIGIESGSPRILRKIRKASDIRLIEWTIGRLFRAGIDVKGYFILGFEPETAEEMRMTYDLAARLKELSMRYGTGFRTSVFQFRPYHGTDLYREITGKGIVIDSVSYQDCLSEDTGRKQFNFASGNFSDASDEELKKFIIATNALNR